MGVTKLISGTGRVRGRNRGGLGNGTEQALDGLGHDQGEDQR